MAVMNADWLRPSWNFDKVGALMTTRDGGVSAGPWASMNLGSANGDDPAHVAANRSLLESTIGATLVHLHQVHGTHVVRHGAGRDLSVSLDADACFTTEPGIACTVLAADCLPVLFAAPGAAGVAAAHAGWRGLSAGVVEATLTALCDATGCEPGDVAVWLGACIGPDHFQVGADVLAAFGRQADAAYADARFQPDTRPDAPADRWLADLAGLARDRLAAAGVRDVSGGSWCTVADPRFFSYRRDGVTGRMAACIWLER
jgi:YfiH family protein